MRSIFQKAELLLSDHWPEHSEFQMANFIVGGQGGLWAQYRQALRELAGRHPDIQNQAARIADLRASIKRERARWFGRRDVVAKIDQDLKSALKIYKSKSREYFFFYRIARDLKRRLGEISTERRRELESNMWIEKARRMAAIDLISIGGLQRSTVEFITSFPRELRRVLLSDLRQENRQKLLSILD